MQPRKPSPILQSIGASPVFALYRIRKRPTTSALQQQSPPTQPNPTFSLNWGNLRLPRDKRFDSDGQACLKRLFREEPSLQGFHRQYPRPSALIRNRLRVSFFAFLRLRCVFAAINPISRAFTRSPAYKAE